MKWAGVILAAGLGVRMRSRLPKVLHPVCGAPMLHHVADAVRSAGVDRLVVVASPALAGMPELPDAIGADAAIAIQPERLGTANALLAAQEACEDATHILSVYADAPLLLASTLETLRTAHLDRGAVATHLVANVDDPTGLGRIVRGSDGEPLGVVEEADADANTRSITEINCGCYAYDAGWLWGALSRIEPATSGEAYLPDTMALAVDDGEKVGTVMVEDPSEILAVNDRAQLAGVEGRMRDRIRRHWMLAGVTLADPGSIYIDPQVRLEPDTIMLPNTHLLGSTTIGEGCEIGPDTVLRDCTVGDRSKVIASHGEASSIGRDVSVGPFSRLRPGAEIEDSVHIGNYAEIKNSTIGSGSHIGHFSYLGDATIGRKVNIGAGTITCNYDGNRKHRTTVCDRAFVGSGSMLVAPLTIGEGAVTGAGAVVTRDVPPDTTVAGVPARACAGRMHSRTHGVDPQEG